MINLSGRLVVYLVGVASIFVILFGIRGSANMLNPILLATVITITVLPIFPTVDAAVRFFETSAQNVGAAG